MTQKFHKYHGAGNDFILVDNRDGGFEPDKNTILRMCRRRFGIGADGVMLLEESENADFSMRYFNADGRESTMCGNGGRCIVLFAHARGIVSEKTTFWASDGYHQANVLDAKTVSLKMQDVTQVWQHQGNDVIDTGSPHYVQWVGDPDQVDVYTQGRALRYDPDIFADGVNVNFVKMMAERHIFIRTYERGVEAETLACGTGSVAAAISAHIRNRSDKSSYTLKARGGTLQVDFEDTGDNIFRDVWLTGPAEKVFEGTFAPTTSTGGSA
jgi:diaminopimelate epimerase